MLSQFSHQPCGCDFHYRAPGAGGGAGTQGAHLALGGEPPLPIPEAPLPLFHSTQEGASKRFTQS